MPEDSGRTRQRARPRRVVMLAYPDAQMLDVSGPLEVFAAATQSLASEAQSLASEAHGLASEAHGDPGYSVEVVALQKGPVRMSSGISILAERSLHQVRGPIDTLLVAGGEGTRAALRDTDLMRWLGREGPRARRLASVCTGAFLLAAAGLLDGRRATTHWSVWEQLRDFFPAVEVDPDPIFIRDGNVYTSAGVTAGMDLALALVEEDVGRVVALGIARRLVMFLKRPGGQSQFSAGLSVELARRDPLRELQTWIVEHPEADLSVDTLARRVGMSARNFARVFTRELRMTPARFVERARVDAARRRLEECSNGIESVADECGFGSAETMRRAFIRSVRVSPAAYRSRFQNRQVPGESQGSARRARR